MFDRCIRCYKSWQVPRSAKAKPRTMASIIVSNCIHIVMNSASLNLGIETYKYKPLYSIVSRPRMILRCDWLIGIT